MMAMGSIATLAFLRTFIDDQGAIADFVPDGLTPDTLQMDAKGMFDLSKNQMVDYFASFTEGSESINIFDMVVASVALPYTYKKTIDSVAEQQKISAEES